MKDKIKTILPYLDLPLMVLALYTVFMYAPTESFMGDTQRIFYFHVSFAWVGFLAFFLNFAGSIMYLIRKTRRWDILAVSTAEIGIAFCIIVLTTGPIWARPVWNTWCTWDPRLVTFLILTFMYVAYMTVRGAIDEETKRARFSAVIGIVAFLNVPLTYLAMKVRTIHPNLREGKKLNLDPRMMTTMRVAVIAITIFFILLLMRRMDLERLRDRVAELRKKIMNES